MISYIITRLIWFYFGGLVAVYPFVRESLQRGNFPEQVIKEWLLWPGLYF